MAEAFARRYGSDVLEAESAGLHPVQIIQPMTKKVMEDKNINLDSQFPKGLEALDVPSFDIIVNMSGTKLPGKTSIEVRDWRIEDPIGQSEEVYIATREHIEMAVMQLILELRRNNQPPKPSKPSKRSQGA